jgi:hypothetical protein
MGVHNDYGVEIDGYPVRVLDSPEPELERANGVGAWIEMWDYVGGVRFRGFVAEKEEEKAMFVFFDQSVVAGDLKAGYVALVHSLVCFDTNISQPHGPPRTLRSRRLLLRPPRRLHRSPRRTNRPRHAR